MTVIKNIHCPLKVVSFGEVLFDIIGGGPFLG